MTDESDLKLARECAAKITAGHVAAFSGDAIRAGKWDGHITVRSALLAIKAERARTVAFLQRYCDGASEFHQDTGSGYCCLKTAANILGAIRCGEHGNG